jgi:hypothetical protein
MHSENLIPSDLRVEGLGLSEEPEEPEGPEEPHAAIVRPQPRTASEAVRKRVR